MKFKVTGKNIVVTEALKEMAIKKVGKLDKYFRRDAEAHITMSVQKNRHIVEVTIPFEGGLLRAEEDNQDMYASIDKVVDSLERQIRRNKTKLEKKVHDGSLRFENFNFDDDAEEEPKFEIVRTKKFAIKPMTVEEAVLQMNLLGHEFFMFSNAETLEANVVYRRKDGNYGLIEPEF
ncbi:ribosome hibernation-promoting factor, HPF/YfiA family [Acetivibrio mesophilus]|uniref:Ribosome hibernation promoting factor n=1 Tax=Acetivibrio mesophilus TaxID=2487273 RepID=A0A4Q0I576_9FIRM|nr:ribosome-associated translation inhibitor RaiA [Acetivibrio mesophilus]ODM26772.1 ribosomal subunit interface protein [Clostridium sp. Bc-iso-3]RXE58122.1 ribosome-associated translation inhibitor RaiA [Acetivibrio mesophilus]